MSIDRIMKNEQLARSVSMTNPAYSIIIPTLNERENILLLLRAIEEVAACHGPMCEVLVVDDRSEDGTAALVASQSFALPLRIIERERLGGLAAAVLRGVAEARGKVVVVMDADLSHPPEAIPALVAPVLAGTHDIMIGSRHVPGGGCPGWPWRRRVMSRVAAWFAMPFTSAADPMSGFFAMRRSDLLALGAAPRGYKILLEALARHTDPRRVAEIPILFQDRKFGRSKLGLHTIRDYLLRLVALGGCSLTPRAGAGFATVGLFGVVVDLAVFTALRSADVNLATAHIASFLTATVSNFLLNARYAFTTDPGLGAYVRFIVVALLALSVRGGVVATALAGGLPEQVSVLAGIGIGAVVNLIGVGFWVFPHSGAAPGRWRLSAVALVTYLMVLRLVYVGQTDLIAEEAYYWGYAQHLDYGYLDHPPLVGWLIAASTTIFGDSVIAIRLPAMLCWLATLVALCRLARSLWGSDAAWGAALALVAMPYVIGCSLIMTPDAPLMAAWAWTLVAGWEAIRGGSIRWWYIGGLALGVGLLAKYTAALLAPALLVALITIPSARRHLSSPHPWMALLLSVACFMPVVLWNLDNDWASFRFQTAGRWSGAVSFHGHDLVRDLLALAGPLTVVAMVLGFRGGFARLRNRDPAAVFTAIMVLVPLSIFIVYAFLHKPRPNWTGPPMLMLIPAVGATLALTMHAVGRCRKRLVIASVLLPLLLTGAFLHYIVIGLPGIPYPWQISRFIGWRQLGGLVADEIRREVEAGRTMPVVCGVDRYNIASQLAFTIPLVSGVQPEIASGGLFGQNDLMYRWWAPPERLRGRDLLLVGRTLDQISAPGVVARFTSLEPARELQVYSPNGTPLFTYVVRIARGYDGNP